jgi:hypothetical protein
LDAEPTEDAEDPVGVDAAPHHESSPRLLAESRDADASHNKQSTSAEFPATQETQINSPDDETRTDRELELEPSPSQSSRQRDPQAQPEGSNSEAVGNVAGDVSIAVAGDDPTKKSLLGRFASTAASWLRPKPRVQSPAPKAPSKLPASDETFVPSKLPLNGSIGLDPLQKAADPEPDPETQLPPQEEPQSPVAIRAEQSRQPVLRALPRRLEDFPALLAAVEEYLGVNETDEDSSEEGDDHSDMDDGTD